MLSQVVLSIVGALLLAAIVAWGFYLYPKSKRVDKPWLLFVLRLLSVFLILLLLLNPQLTRQIKTTVKPELAVVVDQSSSVKALKQQEEVRQQVAFLKQNTLFNDKFDVAYYGLGEQLKPLADSLLFTENYTDFSGLTTLKSAIRNQQLPIILLTDGNQTKGVSAAYLKMRNAVYPVVFGDTTSYKDVYIARINNNPYGFLKNTFPVEVFVNRKGSGTLTSRLSIYYKGQKVCSKDIIFKDNQRSQRVVCQVKPRAVGQQFYTVKVEAAEGEKNKSNNVSKFSIDIVDQRSKVLILSDILHPDLGALKQSIEQNEQREVVLSYGLSKIKKITEYQLVILYQPTSKSKVVLDVLKQQKIPFWMISGTATDWQFLNANQPVYQKKTSTLEENYQSVLNPDFSLFSIGSFDPKNLPPLQDGFGEVSVQSNHDVLLFQKVNQSELETPLLVFAKDDSHKTALLNGEGLWRWRVYDYKNHESFEQFDNFIDVIVQYLTAEKVSQDHFKFDYKRIINESESQQIKVSAFNETFQLDQKAALYFKLYDQNTQVNTAIKIPQTSQGNYALTLDPLPAGDYTFRVEDKYKKTTKTGAFSVIKHDVEKQIYTADYQQMSILADNSGGEVVMPEHLNDLVKQLTENPQYKNIQKVKKINQSFIDWYWLLVLIIVSLTAEWLIRKYRGLI